MLSDFELFKRILKKTKFHSFQHGSHGTRNPHEILKSQFNHNL